MAQAASGCQCRRPAVTSGTHSCQQASPQLSRNSARVPASLSQLHTADRGRQPCFNKAVQRLQISKSNSCHFRTLDRAVHLCPCVGCSAHSCSGDSSSSRHNSDASSQPTHTLQVCSDYQSKWCTWRIDFSQHCKKRFSYCRAMYLS